MDLQLLDNEFIIRGFTIQSSINIVPYHGILLNKHRVIFDFLGKPKDQSWKIVLGLLKI